MAWSAAVHTDDLTMLGLECIGCSELQQSRVVSGGNLSVDHRFKPCQNVSVYNCCIVLVYNIVHNAVESLMYNCY